MPRVVKSREEFEGEIYESLVLVEGSDLPLHRPDNGFTEITHSRRRIDGTQRVTGRARYTQDIYLPAMVHVRLLRSPYPRARIRKIDTKKAEAMPGVRGVLHRFNAPKTAFRGDDTIFREEVRFVGEEVVALAADDEQTAVEALRLVEVDYELLPHVVDLEEAIGDVAPRLESDGNVEEAATHKRGDAKRALREAEFVVDATYRTSTQLHNALETHGAVAAWDGEQLTVYESTQHVFGVRQGLKTALKLPYSKIRVICDYMGGGFGSKGGVGKYSIIASLFAMQLGRPARCVLTRDEENVAAGNRSATLQQLRIGGKGGRITGLEHTSWANVGQGKWVANPTGPTNTLYDIANLTSKSYKVVTNAGSLAAFRAPGYVEGTFALESAVDELAEKMRVDPLTLRRKHAASPKDPMGGKRYSDKHLIECYRIGAAEIGWSRRRSGGVRGSAPHRRRGIGMATQIWGGGGGPPAYATVHVNPDGTVILTAGTQDIGTGTRTVLAQVCADELGVDLDAIHVRLGDTDNPYGPISAGSLTMASVGPAVRLAAKDAREQLLGAAAGVLETPKAELRLEGGVIVSKGARTPLSDVLGKVENNTVIGRGGRHPNDPDLSLRTFGAHFAEVEVDVQTGEITALHIVAVHDIGRIVNPTTARSQVEGGVLQAIGFALTEERFLDRATGRVMNGNLENYKVPTVKDVPAKITVRFVDRPDRRANNLGVKGLGEPPIIPTAAAIANAVANATGARVRHAPLTRARVLEALAIAGARA
jgi:xanthine dehydrogenase YagR molybdenum-binding subunit